MPVPGAMLPGTCGPATAVRNRTSRRAGQPEVTRPAAYPTYAGPELRPAASRRPNGADAVCYEIAAVEREDDGTAVGVDMNA